MLRDRLEAMLMLTLWHLRALLTFVLALAIVVGSIVGIYRLAGHYRTQSDQTASANVGKEVASDLTHNAFDEFLSTRGVNELIDGINTMRLNRTRRSPVMAHRLYNLDCQMAAAHRILELERTEEHQQFAIVAILQALSAREVTTLEEGFIDEQRYEELKSYSARFLDHSNLRIRQAAQIGQVVVGIREMCTDTEPGAGSATEETLSRFHQVGKDNADDPHVGNALFELLDLINQRCERSRWLSFVASYRDAFSGTRDGQVTANVNEAEQWLTLEKASVATSAAK